MPPLWLIARAAASTPAKICGRLSIGVPMGADVATLIGAAVKVGAASAGDEAGELPAEPAQADRVTNRLTSPAALASEHHRLCTGSALVGFLILILLGVLSRLYRHVFRISGQVMCPDFIELPESLRRRAGEYHMSPAEYVHSIGNLQQLIELLLNQQSCHTLIHSGTHCAH